MRDSIPSAQIGADVSGGMVEAEAEEIAVGAPANEASAERGSPAASQPGHERSRRMPGQQRLPRILIKPDRREPDYQGYPDEV